MKYLHTILCKNEGALVADALDWYAARNVPVYLFDNGSSDGTLADAHLRADAGDAVWCSLYKPRAHPSKQSRTDTTVVALSEIDTQWCGAGDADELWNVDADWLAREDLAGYNVISLPMRFFWPHEPDGLRMADMRHYTWSVAWILDGSTPDGPASHAAGRKELFRAAPYKRHINSHQVELHERRRVHKTNARPIDHYIVTSWGHFQNKIESWRALLRLPRPYRLRGGWHIHRWIAGYDAGKISREWFEGRCRAARELPSI